jgi:hypothetical protein
MLSLGKEWKMNCKWGKGGNLSPRQHGTGGGGKPKVGLGLVLPATFIHT